MKFLSGFLIFFLLFAQVGHSEDDPSILEISYFIMSPTVIAPQLGLATEEQFNAALGNLKSQCNDFFNLSYKSLDKQCKSIELTGTVEEYLANPDLPYYYRMTGHCVLKITLSCLNTDN